ncbi:hypothetical protein PpBr36_05391 [Pyricularia pennisetigena]|uniref:hypothetical protein n=1 Tax=Pyricularia pennisetigena TaxID=1578925 RepID=UPI00114E632B|nr:hypothetical protein PpBr36_05391 [Pyricularia pennisetigena]TLS27549.1 hypothetical protein PpBr36_05391 [Pyricularia pennisetigena]
METSCRRYLAWDWPDLSSKDTPDSGAQRKSRKDDECLPSRLIQDLVKIDNRAFADQMVIFHQIFLARFVLVNTGADEIAQSAFKRAKEIISNELPNKDVCLILSSRGNSMQDLIWTLLQARSTYSSRKDSKAYIWLEKFSERVVHYGAVLDVFVQHQPEYTSLVWGTFKFLFTAVVNHAGKVKNLAKACCRTAEALPRADLGLILYPTPAMQEAVAQLYAAIIKFALRALRWYQQGRLMHLATAIASPWALSFEEELFEIERNSKSVEELAQSAARAELRELRFQVHQGRSDQQQARAELLQLKNAPAQLAMKSLQASISSDTKFSKKMICEIQLGQILSLPFMESLPTSGQSLAYCRSFWLRRRRARRTESCAVNVSSLKTWNQAEQIRFVVVESGNSTLARDLLVDVITVLRRHGLPVLWALRPQNLHETNLTTVDVLRMLLYQALEVNSAAVGRSYPITVAHLREASGHDDWLALLKRALEDCPTIFVVFDAELVDHLTDGDRSLATRGF